MHNKDPKSLLEEDISITIALTSLDVTLRKQSDILCPKAEYRTKWQETEQWIYEKINVIKEFALGKEVDVYDSSTAQIALKDIILLLAYLYKNYKIIINKDEPLSEQFANIVISGKSDDMLRLSLSPPFSPKKSKIAIIDDINYTEEKYLHNEEFAKFSDVIEAPQKNNCWKKTKEIFSKCQLFSIYDIKYDNPILNNPELLKQLAAKFTLTKIVNISHKLMQNGHNELLSKAVNNNDIESLELLLGNNADHFNESSSN